MLQKKHVPKCHMPSQNPQRMVWVWSCHRSAESKLENFQLRLANQTGQRGHISTFCVFSTHIIWFNLRSPTFIVHMRRILQKYRQSMLQYVSAGSHHQWSHEYIWKDLWSINLILCIHMASGDGSLLKQVGSKPHMLLLIVYFVSISHNVTLPYMVTVCYKNTLGQFRLFHKHHYSYLLCPCSVSCKLNTAPMSPWRSYHIDRKCCRPGVSYPDDPYQGQYLQLDYKTVETQFPNQCVWKLKTVNMSRITVLFFINPK